MGFPRKAVAVVFTGVLGALMPGAASASGTMNIHHADGHVNTYRDIDIRVFSGSLFLTSQDGDGTIVVTRAACSYQGKIIVCLPTAAVLVQNGKSNVLDLKTGTIYLNYTDTSQPLAFTSARLPANSVMLAISTRNGTSVNLQGRIDRLVRQ